MTNGQLYARAMASTLRILEQVPRDQWHAPTPCTESDARQGDLTRAFRAAGVSGDELAVADDADQQTKLLALVGRRP